MAARALVTGAGGFVGRHLTEHLRSLGHTVVAPPSGEADLRDADAARRIVFGARPDVVYHLAARASVARSWEDPRAALVDNQVMTLNVLDAARSAASSAAVLVASSGEVYGPPPELPVTEAARLRPQNPYAVSKAACDLLAGLYADAHGMPVVRTRAFNHAGPGQGDTYLVGSLTRQVADAERAGGGRVALRTGNPATRRDFTDVRDVVRAYALAAERGPAVFNVASGRAASAADVVALLRGMTELEIEHEVDPARVRDGEVPEIAGSAAALAEATGWQAEIPFEQTVRDALEYWRAA